MNAGFLIPSPGGGATSRTDLMLVDLVSPWFAAVEATGSDAARAAFRLRHQQLLESLRQQRTPLSAALPLADQPATLKSLARRASDPALQQALRAALTRMHDLGADRCRELVMLAGDGRGDAIEAVPWPAAVAALFLDCAGDDEAMVIEFARAATVITRWCAADSASAVRQHAATGWNRLQLQRDVELREWICAEGLGVHLVQQLLPSLPAHRAVGVSRGALSALRRREKSLHALLDADLDQRGLGLALRWLTPAAPAGQRTVSGVVIPPMAGRYLGWRMLAARVGRTGLREAIRMEA